MGSQIWSLLSLGVGLNLVLGALVAAFKLPIYLDSLGTVLVGALAGPGPAALAGGCGVALLGLTSPTALAFLPVGLAVGVLTGLAAKLGVFRSAWSAGLVGALVGCASAAISAPIASYMFGGVTGGGTDLMVALFRAGGLSTLQAAFGQGLAVDPADKAATFLLVYALLRALPRRATAAFPLAARLPHPPNVAVAQYRPQQRDLSSEQTSRRHYPAVAPPPSARSTASPYPQASSGWKFLALLSLLLMAGLAPRPTGLTAALFALLASFGLAAPALTWRLTGRLCLALLPLALSLAVIHGLVARSEEEIRAVWMGLSWSPLGLSTAWHFLVRVAVMLLAVSMFLATTPLQRIAELLLRWRVPYALVFVLLTGANLGTRLQHRWRIVEEAQQARGLDLHPPGKWARLRVLMQLLTPTLGAVFSEIPLRAANLESRGFLTARPKADIPPAWTGEPEPSTSGWLFHLWLVLASWSFLLWSYS